MKQVTIDQGSGFCSGVRLAIRRVEEELQKHGHLFCLGEIVHNEAEVNRLKELGLEIIDHEKFNTLHDCVVLIRSHGEPPDTFQTAKNNRIELINATCPTVIKLQKRIKASYEDSLQHNGQIVIFGKPGHAETIGLNGQTSGNAIVIQSENDILKINPAQPVHLFSQTTMNREEYFQLLAKLKDYHSHPESITVHDTICRQVSNQVPHLHEFAGLHNVIVFVSGKNSSNGKYLYNVCKQVNPNSYFVADISELQPEWFLGIETVGICGATSTPGWLLESVAEAVKKMK